MTIYISGPMSGLPEYNRPAFHKKEAELRAHGCRVLNPAKIGDLPYEMYWPINRAMLDGSDAIYMLDGWENSKGARKEFAHAVKSGLLVMFESAAFFNKLLDYKAHSIGISGLPDCNTCAAHKNCPHAPKLGQWVRINCHLWEEAKCEK